MNRIRKFISEWRGVIVCVIAIVVMVSGIIWASNRPHLPEGRVTNKMHFPAHSVCDNKTCDFRPEKWIVSVQNGDEFDSWYVSERYYDNVHIGDWVKK